MGILFQTDAHTEKTILNLQKPRENEIYLANKSVEIYQGICKSRYVYRDMFQNISRFSRTKRVF